MRQKKANNTAFSIKLFMIIAGLGVFFGVGVSAQYDAADPPALPSDFDVPLNTSNTEQTKKGLLTIKGVFTAAHTLCVGGCFNEGGSSMICWNDNGTRSNCKSGWNDLTGGPYVQYGTAVSPIPSPGYDEGYAEITRLANGAALIGTAGAPTEYQYSLGILGIASAAQTGASAGIAGEARSDNNPLHYAVLAQAIHPNFRAAFFEGNVYIRSGMDLWVGKDIPSSRSRNDTSEICLNGDCRSNWPNGDTSLWKLDNNNNTLWPNNVDLNLSIGGTNQNAPLTITKLPSQKTQLLVKGSSTFKRSTPDSYSSDTKTGKIVIGDPATGFPRSSTCGDGICNNSECAQDSNPSCTIDHSNYCALDCDFTPPGQVQVLSRTVQNRMVTIDWLLPTGPQSRDLAGTRVILKTTGYPHNPYDGQWTDIPKPAQGNRSSFTTPPLDANVQYYVGLWTYDSAQNYSGTVVEPLSLVVEGEGGGPGREEEGFILRRPGGP